MDALAAVIPSVGVGVLFWYAIRAMVQADRRERAAMNRLEMQEKADVE